MAFCLRCPPQENSDSCPPWPPSRPILVALYPDARLRWARLLVAEGLLQVDTGLFGHLVEHRRLHPIQFVALAGGLDELAHDVLRQCFAVLVDRLDDFCLAHRQAFRPCWRWTRPHLGGSRRSGRARRGTCLCLCPRSWAAPGGNGPLFYCRLVGMKTQKQEQKTPLPGPAQRVRQRGWPCTVSTLMRCASPESRSLDHLVRIKKVSRWGEKRGT